MNGAAPVTRTTARGLTRAEKPAAAALAAAAIFVWARPILSSLWLDETVTYWVISDGPRHIMERAVRFQASPLYFWIPWLFSKVAGPGEISLRLPSLLAAAATLWVVFRTARVRFDTATATAAVLLLAFFKNFAFAACDARPYATALLSSAASVYFLQRRLRGGSKTDLLGYVLTASLTAYLQPLYAMMFAVHAAFATHQGPSRGRSVQSFLFSLIPCALLLLPLWPQISSLAGRRELLGIPNEPLWPFLRPFARFALVLGTGLAVLRISGAIRFRALEEMKGVWPFAVWALLPAALLFAVSRTLSEGLFLPRYFLCGAPGLAMSLAVLWRQLEPRWARHTVLSAMVAFWLAMGVPATHSPEDWRGALDAARSLSATGTPVLLRSALMESQSVTWLRDREAARYLTAPAGLYLTGTAQSIPLPRDADSPERARYLSDVAAGVRNARRLVLVEHADSDIGARVKNLLSPAGFAAKPAGTFGNLQVILYCHP